MVHRVMASRLAALLVAVIFGLASSLSAQGAERATSRGARAPKLVISRVMADPTVVPDEQGEWVEITNLSDGVIDLRGWSLRSANDAGWVVPSSLRVRARSAVVLARNGDPTSNGGVNAAAVYSGIALANAGDWLALHDPAGVTVDSLAWGRAPRGEPIVHWVAGEGVRSADLASRRRPATAPQPAIVTPVVTDTPRLNAGRRALPGAPRAVVPVSELVVRVLDIGQGDAILIQNGGSTVLVDGGPKPHLLGEYLTALGIDGGTVDAVILSHAHADHYQGLRELFASRRHITVRYFWENQDASPNSTLQALRDSIGARVAAGTLTYRDTDDPCANGQPLCTITLRGGAKLHIMRPDPSGVGANNRSPALKLVGPDSASFTMWLAGDAEHEAIEWFDRTAGYSTNPGMHVNVLKANHHGSCNGVTDRYLELTHPELVVASVGAVNDYGHMHEQAESLFARHGVPWYRTDQNGTITLRSAGMPGTGYTVSVERTGVNLRGPSDRRAHQPKCAGM